MKPIKWAIKWSASAAIFFTLFAFALNNQQPATLHFFFGRQWQTPMVLVVLCAFAVGLAVGVLAMVPRWWKHRRAALRADMPAMPVAASKEASPKAPRAAPTSDAPDGV